MLIWARGLHLLHVACINLFVAVFNYGLAVIRLEKSGTRSYGFKYCVTQKFVTKYLIT